MLDNMSQFLKKSVVSNGAKDALIVADKKLGSAINEKVRSHVHDALLHSSIPFFTNPYIMDMVSSRRQHSLTLLVSSLFIVICNIFASVDLSQLLYYSMPTFVSLELEQLKISCVNDDFANELLRGIRGEE